MRATQLSSLPPNRSRGGGGRPCERIASSRGKGRSGMEKYFGSSYRGDPAVPHFPPEVFIDTWIGAFAFSAITYFHPYMWNISNQYNWHDRAMLFEHYHWKKAMEKKQPYAFRWNKHMSPEERESYYYNWPHYFK